MGSLFLAVAGCVDFYCVAFQRILGPVKFGIEQAEPGVSKNDSVASKVGDVEAQFFNSGALAGPKVTEVGNGSIAVGGSIYIIDSEGDAQFFNADSQGFNGARVDEVVCGATV